MKKKEKNSKVFLILPFLILLEGLFIGYMLWHFSSIKSSFDLGMSFNIAAFVIIEIINLILFVVYLKKKDTVNFKISLLLTILYLGALFVFPIYQASSSVEDSKTHEMSAKQSYFNVYGVNIDNLISMWE